MSLETLLDASSGAFPYLAATSQRRRRRKEAPATSSNVPPAATRRSSQPELVFFSAFGADSAFASASARSLLVGVVHSVLLDIAPFPRLVAGIEAAWHLAQVAVRVSLDVLRHIVVRIDFLVL